MGWIFFDPPWRVGSKNPLNLTQPDPCTPLIASIHANFFYSRESEVHCIESEQQALLKFKQHLNDPLNLLASWAGDEDCCQWEGVVCHNVTSHVYELHLRSIPLPPYDYSGDVNIYDAEVEAYERSKFGGNLNPSLLDLKHLNYLDLSYNNFNGTQIPRFVSSMEV